MNFELSARAESDVETIAQWWEENRDVGSELFFGELETAEVQLLAQPESGKPWRRRGEELVRTWLLPKTKYQLYYVCRPEEEQLFVLTIWGTERRDPKL